MICLLYQTENYESKNQLPMKKYAKKLLAQLLMPSTVYVYTAVETLSIAVG